MSDSLAGKTVLVMGARGMLASDLIPRLLETNAMLALFDVASGESNECAISACDVTNADAVLRTVRQVAPEWIINCAAYTRVDDAQVQQELAFRVNSVGPANLAVAARDTNARLLHVSSDYVFGGEAEFLRDESRSVSSIPIPEDRELCPCGIYGQSKRFGDEFVSRILPEHHLIVRTSWLHGVHGPNFLETILRLAKERDELRVVSDQIGSPTWSAWLAETMIALIIRDARGVFNTTSRGDISWFDFAREIVSLAGLPTKVMKQSTEELARPAPRPAYSTLDLSKLEQFLGRDAIGWQEGVRRHMQQLGALTEE